MPRFVLLRHETPADSPRGSHWDLMFEREGILRTWAIQELPAEDRVIQAEQLADHRLHYLDYEGPISGNRGEVRRADAGEYEIVHETADALAVIVQGAQLRGRLELSRLANQHWELRLKSETA